MRSAMAHETESAELEWVRQAQSSVKEAERLLLSPNVHSMEECAPRLESAIECVRALESSLRGRKKPNRELAAALGALRAEIARANALLERAGAFYAGWARLLYAAACGYNARGEPASPTVRRFSVEG
jgi:hypothetical protein